MKPLVLLLLAFLVSASIASTLKTNVNAGETYGLIEVGASGIKGQVIKTVVAATEGPPIQTIKEYAPVDANAFAIDPSSSDRIKKAVGQIRDQMQRDFGLTADHFYVVGSSGLPDTAKAILSNLDFGGSNKIDFISTDQESTFLFRGIVSFEKSPDVVSLDIGSGNSKGAYLERSAPSLTFASFSIPWGTKTAAKAIDQARNSGDFLSAAQAFRTHTIEPAVRAQAEQYPGMQNRRCVYLSGGIVWAMETLLHPFAQEDALEKVTVDDINTFCQKAASNPTALLHPDLDALVKSNPSVSQPIIETAKTEIPRVSTVFNENQLVAGSLILQTFSAEMHLNQKDAIFFARTALNAVTRGYLVEKISDSDSK